VTFFDTADSYVAGASERATGGLLRKFFSRREDYVLATKTFYPTGPGPNGRGLSRKHILTAIPHLPRPSLQPAAARDTSRQPALNDLLFGTPALITLPAREPYRRR